MDMAKRVIPVGFGRFDHLAFEKEKCGGIGGLKQGIAERLDGGAVGGFLALEGCRNCQAQAQEAGEGEAPRL
jgi:hypothetical protein